MRVVIHHRHRQQGCDWLFRFWQLNTDFDSILAHVMSDTLTLTVSRRGPGGKPIEIQLPSKATTQDLFSLVAAKTKVRDCMDRTLAVMYVDTLVGAAEKHTQATDHHLGQKDCIDQ